MSSFLRSLLTLADNESYDIGRLLWLIGVLAFVICACADTWAKKSFDYLSYAGAFAAIMTGCAGAQRIKLKTEEKN